MKSKTRTKEESLKFVITGEIFLEKVFDLLEDINFDQLGYEGLERIHLEHLNEQDWNKVGWIFTPKYIIRFRIHQTKLLTDLIHSSSIHYSFNGLKKF